MRNNPAAAGPLDGPTALPSAVEAAEGSAAVYQRVHSSAEFRQVRRRYQGFVFPVVIGMLGCYLLYAVVSVTAPGFMGAKLFGEVNVGFVFTALQLVSIMILAHWYGRHAKAKRDNAALKLRWQVQEELQCQEKLR
ncbi:MAG: DUF485 domain-containing protein [Streptomycetaceae bacterium]|nr:DUF485 domain-containing protein [Streptomycetaceae bacterium]